VGIQTAFKTLIFALILPYVGVILIAAFATGSSVGETTVKNIGPILLWLLPIFAIINLFGSFMSAKAYD
jgi:hypothetical protein